MEKSSEQIVSDLKGRGHAFMPIDIDLLESAESGARIFLLAQAENWHDWNFERTDEAQFGIVEEISSHAGPVSKRQLALSFTHDLSRRKSADDPHAKACLGAITELYRDMRRRVSDITSELERYCDTPDVPARIRSTFETGNERATTLLLRSSLCGRRSLANTLHAESVLSMYFASDDSEIWLKDEATDKWLLRSPPYGSVLLFFGLNVGELGNPAFKPSMYRIDGHSGSSIHSTIMHVQIKETVVAVEVPSNVEPFVV